MNMLTQNEILVVSKYFDKFNDYINIIKTCKEYNNILNLFRYNPIPLDEQIYKYFPNIQTLHIYDKDDFKNININIPKIIWYNVNYNTYKSDKINLYKNILITKEDIEKYGINILNKNENENIIEIGNNCFKHFDLKDLGGKADLNLKDLVIPNSVTKIYNNCFNDCTNLTNLVLSTNLKEIGYGCFNEYVNLKELIIPNSVAKIDCDCFNDCTNLTKLVLSSNLKKINGRCFNRCKSLRELVIPDSVTIIYCKCFNECTNLTKLVLSTNLKEIDIWCFNDIIALKELVIPNSVTKIESLCFNNCTNLTNFVSSTITLNEIINSNYNMLYRRYK